MGRTFERNHFAGRIHDGRIGANWPSDWIVAIVHIDDDHLSRIGGFLTHTDEFVRFHRERAERYRAGGNADICELQNIQRIQLIKF